MSISRELLLQQIPFVIQETELVGLGQRYIGKVRDSYTVSGRRVMVTTDRLSAFDRVLTTVPLKGQVLQRMAVQWFRWTEDIISNHLIDVPDPQVLVVSECQILPLEIVVRGYLTGSAWRDYQAGRTISGVRLPAGLMHGHRFDAPLFTPSTKADVGEHDLPISEEEILARGIVSKRLLEEVHSIALALFQRGTERAAAQQLALVDTKYEFGIRDGKLVLADEIHTLDSSRYWKTAGLAERLARGEQPEMLDKEPVRQWLLQQGFRGEGPAPQFTDAHRAQIAEHYISAAESVLGEAFSPILGDGNTRLRGVAARLANA
jgi:phosphoribosylaminoimidazole-succinocarboxamide synthase